jgi:hypothetical protein
MPGGTQRKTSTESGGLNPGPKVANKRLLKRSKLEQNGLFHGSAEICAPAQTTSLVYQSLLTDTDMDATP